DTAAHGSDRVIVLDQKHCGSRRGPGYLALALAGHGRRDATVHDGEIDLEASAFAQGTLDVQIASALLNDAIHRGKPEARALAHLFGGEKWFENTPEGLLAHANARVSDAQHRVATLRHSGESGWVSRVHANAFGSKGELAAFGHGISSIDRQVQEHLFQLPCVG